MFFYISFLRPPPLQAPSTGTILITPQIANDLRTEPFTDAQDIFYSWSQSSGSPTRGSTIKYTKLTTWRQATAYKEIPVPVPQGVRSGQTWRLLLSAQAHGSPVINLEAGDLGRLPFPVLSMPISFGPRGSGRKQEQVERMYQLPHMSGTEDTPGVSLRIMEQTSFDLDKKVWDSGIGLSSWLVELSRAETPELSGLKDALFSLEPRNILELGAGTGIVSLTIGALLSSRIAPSEDTPPNGCIISTDLDSAMPLLEHNISSNSDLFTATSLEARVLDWDEEVLPDYICAFTDGFDAIIMADVTYNTASFPALVRTLSSILKLGSTPPPILLGYKERDEAERTLWDLARDIGLEFKKIGERKGAGGAPVEIWLGHIRPP